MQMYELYLICKRISPCFFLIYQMEKKRGMKYKSCVAQTICLANANDRFVHRKR